MSLTAFAIGSVISALVGGITNLISTSMTNSANRAMQDSANQTNKDLAALTNQTQIDLANTAHQREVADLKSAGLNPWLSAQGNGAGVPSLNTAQVQASRNQSFGDLGFSSIASTMQSLAFMSALNASRGYAAQSAAQAKIDAATINASSREKIANEYLKLKRGNLRHNNTAKAVEDEIMTEAEYKRLLKEIKG